MLEADNVFIRPCQPASSCVPCREGTPALTGSALPPLTQQLDANWRVIDEHHLTRTWRFPDFASALAFVNAIGAIAEAEDHHPDLQLAWGRVQVDIWTHTINGLSLSDFVFAAKLDAL